MVWIHPHVERHVPVSVTDLEFDPNDLSPLPISVASIRQLLHVFSQVIRASQGEEAHGAQSSVSMPLNAGRVSVEGDPNPSSLAESCARATNPTVASDCTGLPGSGLAAPTSSGERGVQ